MMALARKIVNGEEQDEAETVEAVFAQARDAEELLVDEGWMAVEVEPTVVETHRNGNGAGRAAVSVNGNGRHEEAVKGQQSLFSWAEFMAEEPVKPKGRGRKAQPAPPSLFDWALDLEKEREEDLIGLSA